MSVSAPRRVGRYEVIREIGRGGMAIVYLARQVDLDRQVALKELASLHAGSPDFVERFLREARLAGSLSHPNIVTVHEYFEQDGTAYIAMEYLERGSLRPFVGALDLPQVGGVLDGLLAGLAHAGRRGVVHRDLKPENVMVTLEGSVKIADFGIAKALAGPNGRSLTESGATVGTPAYIAPELALGGEIGPWTDLYAVGVLAYELLAGRAPFHDTEMPLALMLRHAKEQAPSLESVRPDLPAELAMWVGRLLEKTPSARPSSAAAAAEELDEILATAIGPRWRRRAGLPEASGVVPIPSGPARTPVMPALPRSRPFRRRLLLASALVAVGAAAGLLAWARSDDDPVPDAAPKLVADVVPRSADRLALTLVGQRVIVLDPAGRIVAADSKTLRPEGSLANPARPRSAVVARGSLLVADRATLTALDPRTLRARAAVGIEGPARLARGDGRDPVITIERGAKSRLCTVGPDLRLRPCVDLSFAPSGLGVDPGGSTVWVSDAISGAVTVFARTGRVIRPLGEPIDVGRVVRGQIAIGKTTVVVPVKRGVALVDARTRAVRKLPLPVTPSDVWLSDASRRLFAALPGIDRIAVLRLARPDDAPLLVRAGDMPVGLTGGASASVYAVSARDGLLTRLDGRSGAKRGSRALSALTAPKPRPLRLAGARRRTNDGLEFTLALTGGTLPSSGLVIREGTITDGRAVLELWQGAIATRVSTTRLGDLTVRVSRLAGHLSVLLTTPTGRYERLRIRRSDGHTLRISATKTPAPPNGGSTSSAGGTSSSGETGGTVSPPRPPPAKPKKPTYDVF